MPMYRVLSGSEDVIYVFSADDDEQAERLARQISVATAGTPSQHAPTPHFVSVEGLVEEHWRRVSAWVPSPGEDR